MSKPATKSRKTKRDKQNVVERPILFSGDMVRAILDGHKTQTRRIIKPQPVRTHSEVWQLSEKHWMHQWIPGQHAGPVAHCPYGRPGHRLWVRETWLPDPPMDGTWDYYAFTDGVIYNFDALPEQFRSPEHVMYEASQPDVNLRWKPSIHMFRWASRITLEITRVRVERLQDISDQDAVREGVEALDSFDPEFGARGTFRELWQSINGETSWDENPWVWAVEFELAEAR